MPTFDLQCIDCKLVVEKLFTSPIDFIGYQRYLDKYLESIDVIPGYTLIHTNPNLYYCECGQPQEILTPMTNMQPDKLWSGVMTQQGYFTSQKQLNNFRKENHIEKIDKSIVEEVRKKGNNRIKDHIAKTAKQRERVIAEEVKQYDVPE